MDSDGAPGFEPRPRPLERPKPAAEGAAPLVMGSIRTWLNRGGGGGGSWKRHYSSLNISLRETRAVRGRPIWGSRPEKYATRHELPRRLLPVLLLTGERLRPGGGCAGQDEGRRGCSETCSCSVSAKGQAETSGSQTGHRTGRWVRWRRHAMGRRRLSVTFVVGCKSHMSRNIPIPLWVRTALILLTHERELPLKYAPALSAPQWRPAPWARQQSGPPEALRRR